MKSAGDFLELADKPNSQQCSAIARELAVKYINHEVDKVEMIYHHFKSAGSQILTRKTFLPIDLSTEKLGQENDRDLTSNMATAKTQEYIRQHGSNKTVAASDNVELTALIPRQLDLMFYTALLDSNASEHAARMVAMQTATDNADELLKQLNLQYNKSRQQAITNELLDIVGGSVNN